MDVAVAVHFIDAPPVLLQGIEIRLDVFRRRTFIFVRVRRRHLGGVGAEYQLMTDGTWGCQPREVDGAILRTGMEVMVFGLWVGGYHRHGIKLQAVEHHTRISIGNTRLQLSGIGNDDGLSFSDIERDERRAGLQRTLGCRGEFLTSGHHCTIDADIYVGLYLILVRVVVVGLQ